MDMVCPFTLGRTPPNPETCIGSSCAAWRGQVLPGHLVLVAGRPGEGNRTVSRKAAEQFKWPILPFENGHCGVGGHT